MRRAILRIYNASFHTRAYWLKRIAQNSLLNSVKYLLGLETVNCKRESEEVPSQILIPIQVSIAFNITLKKALLKNPLPSDHQYYIKSLKIKYNQKDENDKYLYFNTENISDSYIWNIKATFQRSGEYCSLTVFSFIAIIT